MKRLAFASAALTLALVGCSAPTGSPQSGLLDEFGLTGKDTVEVIEHLDELPVADRPLDLMAAVRPDELVLSDADEEISMDMPEDSMYVSIAPYAEQTHDCFYHSLTTCQGEISGESVTVTITEDGTGDVLVDEETTTFDNGFIGYWLPRDLTGTITVDHDGRSGTTQFSTAEDGATCITDLQLTR
ncbi:CueP family metal-binding protein [Brevibacterium daeguense]|uniref:CueP family metal-binding protein n=1 Tax=Brevibacterium daeguense TaxID=909936 RepID=A0ABP8ENU7_9MICO|nr:CueP family metal-binding protein [Brevibacterium daeguense]